MAIPMASEVIDTHQNHALRFICFICIINKSVYNVVDFTQEKPYELPVIDLIYPHDEKFAPERFLTTSFRRRIFRSCIDLSQRFVEHDGGGVGEVERADVVELNGNVVHILFICFQQL